MQCHRNTTGTTVAGNLHIKTRTCVTRDGEKQRTAGEDENSARRFRLKQMSGTRHGLTGLELARPAGLTVTYQVLELAASTTGMPMALEKATYVGTLVSLATTGSPRK